MNKTRHLLIGLTIAALGISGAAQARGDGDGTRMQRDGARLEQRSERHGDGERRRMQEQSRRHDAGHGHAAGHRIDRRQDRQQARIRDGWRDGELTRGERSRLIRQQWKIALMEQRFAADGHLSGKERRRLERALDKASAQIRRAKHNGLERGDRLAFRDSYDLYRWDHGHH